MTETTAGLVERLTGLLRAFSGRGLVKRIGEHLWFREDVAVRALLATITRLQAERDTARGDALREAAGKVRATMRINGGDAELSDTQAANLDGWLLALEIAEGRILAMIPKEDQ